MFGNQNQSNQQNGGISVNTTLKSFYSDTSVLTLAGWNTQLSIKFTPCTGKDAQGMRQYDNNRKVSTALMQEKAKALLSGIDKKIIPAIEAYRSGTEVDNVSVSVSMGAADKKNVLSVEFKKGDDGKMHTYLILSHMIGPDNTVSPANVFVYTFGELTYVTDYNPSSGSFGEEIAVDSEWEVFYDVLKESIRMIPITGHANQYVQMVRARFAGSNNFSGNNSYNNNNQSYNNQGSDGFMSINMSGPEELPFN